MGNFSIHAHFFNAKKVLRQFIKPFLVLFGVYLVAMLSIWRSGFSYEDDLWRAFYGYAWPDDFNRNTSTNLMQGLNVNKLLTDISPLPQILAVAILAVAGIILTHTICNGKITYLALLPSLFIGLFPFMHGVLSFKFDALCIALSVFACILPFIAWRKILEIAVWRSNLFTLIKSSVLILLSLFTMWTSYQAANGIFLLLILFLALNSYLEKAKVTKIIKTSMFFLINYLISGFIFKLTLSAEKYYHDISTFSLSELPAGIMRNIQKLLSIMYASMNKEWKVLILLFFACFMLTLFVFSARKVVFRFVNCFLGSVIVAICIPLSFGVFLLLKEPLFYGRQLIGIGILPAAIGVIIVHIIDYKQGVFTKLKVHKAIKAALISPALVLLYSFIVFSLALGNGFADQDRYGNFRTELLLNDLSRIYTSKEAVAKTTMQIQGNIGMSTVMKHVNYVYPVTKTLLMRSSYGLSLIDLGHAKLQYYYSREQKFAESYPPKGEKWDCDQMKTLLDSYYHKISEGSEGKVCVVLK
ncbi:MAG: glucosyltransferase domain-containing protein [Bifidobacteriaceae bacterium]|jgi:hypothetical protein|nr:glucosyltransferase domain-containing protein [Bifidobacteriaceae bacterium]